MATIHDLEFAGIPPELRLRIYALLLTTPGRIHFNDYKQLRKTRFPTKDLRRQERIATRTFSVLVRVSKQIKNEVEDWFFNNTTFTFLRDDYTMIEYGWENQIYGRSLRTLSDSISPKLKHIELLDGIQYFSVATDTVLGTLIAEPTIHLCRISIDCKSSGLSMTWTKRPSIANDGLSEIDRQWLTSMRLDHYCSPVWLENAKNVDDRVEAAIRGVLEKQTAGEGLSMTALRAVLRLFDLEVLKY